MTVTTTSERTSLQKLQTTPPNDHHEPMPVHVREHADGHVVRLNTTQPPMVVKMHDAIDVWIKDANRLGGEMGIQHLAKFAARIQRKRDIFTDWAADLRADLPADLEGFHESHFLAAETRIDRAVRILSGEQA